MEPIHTPDNLVLRDWQFKATEQAVSAFTEKDRDLWVTEACTGSGKTTHGVAVAAELLRQNQVDLVVVVTPSIPTRAGWVQSMGTWRLDATDDPNLLTVRDFNALAVTYGGCGKLLDALTHRATHTGLLVIFDEYHHAEETAAWGTYVLTLIGMARFSLLLSGTPWRSTGHIAALTKRTNRYGRAYYQGTRVEADYKYTYKEDLAQKGADRGTIPVRFTFVDSVVTNVETGHVDRLEKPNLEHMTPADREEWITFNLTNETRFGRHIRTQPSSGLDYSLSRNKTVRTLLEAGVDALESYRFRCGHSTPIALLVASSIKEARALAAYTTEVLGMRTDLLVSDKEVATDELHRIKEKCANGALDVLVSVGMVSEGVDIPQIKVVVYLSAIQTMLYIVQVIGRLLRRIRIGNGYMDRTPNELPGMFFAPAVPKLVAIARRIEDEISEYLHDAAEGGDGPGDDGEPEDIVDPPATEPELQVLTNGEVERVYRGSELHSRWSQALEAMQMHEKAEACYIDSSWAEWVMSMILRGEQSGWTEAQRQMAEKCSCLGLDMNELLADVVKVAGGALTKQQQHRLMSKEAEMLRNQIRNTVSPFKDEPDHAKAFAAIGAFINKLCGIKSITTADLEQKRAYLQAAKAIIDSARNG